MLCLQGQCSKEQPSQGLRQVDDQKSALLQLDYALLSQIRLHTDFKVQRSCLLEGSVLKATLFRDHLGKSSLHKTHGNLIAARKESFYQHLFSRQLPLSRLGWSSSWGSW